MGADADTGVLGAPAAAPGTDRTLHVALGRRVEIVGDLLLPPEPSDSSRAACRDIARRLEEWQGPGVVILCGRLVAPGCHIDPSGVVAKHPDLIDALGSFAARADSQVIVIMVPAERDPALVQALERRGVAVRDAVDLACETGAGTRTVLVRAGSLRPDRHPPVDAAPTDDRPWLAGMERLDDPQLARRFVTSRAALPPAAPLPLGAAARAGRHRAVAALRSSSSTVWAGCSARPGSRPHSSGRTTPPGPPASSSPRSSPSACSPCWPSSSPSRHGGSGAPSGARASPHHGPAAPRGRGRSRTTNSRLDGEDALDVTRAAVEAGASGVIVGGALVPELTHLDAGFFACPGATSEVVHEHRGRLGLPPTFLHHRQESTLEIETGAELHVRLLLAEADLPLATMGERLVTSDAVVKGRSKAADVHAELAASWPSWGIVAARARGGGRPHPGAPYPASGRGLPLRGRGHRPALLGDHASARAPASHRPVPARRRGPGGRGPDRHRRHRHDHAVARRPAGTAPLLAGRGGPARRVARSAPPPRRRHHHAVRLRRGPHAAHRPARALPGPDRTGHPRHRLRHPRRRRGAWRRWGASWPWRWPATSTTTPSRAGPTCSSARPSGSSACSRWPSRPPSTVTPPSAFSPSASA